jgi:drug/metabolite transporter (DMT)-like permease
MGLPVAAPSRQRAEPLLTAFLALLSAISWGAADFAGGLATRLSSNFVAVLLTQGVGLVLATVLLLGSGEGRPPDEALAWAAAAGLSGTSGLALFYLALSRGTMGLVAPLTALLGAAIPAMVGLVNGDRAGPLVLVGMVAALAAVVLIAVPDRRLGSPVLATYHGSRGREWLLILGASLGFAGFFLFVDASHGAGGDVWWPLFTVKVAGVTTILGAALLAGSLGRLPALRWGTAALLIGSLAGVADLGGNLFFVLASAEGELAVAVVISSLYPAGTALLARLILHERLGPLRLAGVALAIAGVVLIGLGTL